MSRIHNYEFVFPEHGRIINILITIKLIDCEPYFFIHVIFQLKLRFNFQIQAIQVFFRKKSLIVRPYVLLFDVLLLKDCDKELV